MYYYGSKEDSTEAVPLGEQLGKGERPRGGRNEDDFRPSSKLDENDIANSFRD